MSARTIVPWKRLNESRTPPMSRRFVMAERKGVSWLTLLIVIWALVGSVAAIYYFNGYNSAQERVTDLEDTISEMEERAGRPYCVVLIDYRPAITNVTVPQPMESHIAYFATGVNDTALNVTLGVADVEYEMVTWGASIVSINDARGVYAEGRWWAIYINGEFAESTAEKQKVSNGDLVVWKLLLSTEWG